MSERTNPGALQDLHAALVVLEETPAPIPAPQWVAPVWPATDPNMTPAAHANRTRTLALLQGMFAGADLPQIRAWTLDGDSPRHGGGPVIHAQLAYLDNDELIHDAIAAWTNVLPGGFPWCEIWDNGTTMLAARSFFDGQLVEIWTTLHARITGTPAVTPTPQAPSRPSPLAASATRVDPFADTQTFPAIPFAGAMASVAPVEQILQGVLGDTEDADEPHFTMPTIGH